MKIPQLLGIGSCRIHRPLQRVAATGAARRWNDRVPTWFTHSSGEAVQYGRALTGGLDIPPALRPFVCETATTLPLNLRAEPIAPLDCVVVELSTLKRYEVMGVKLNANRVWGEEVRLGLDSRSLLDGDTSMLPEGHPLKGLEVSAYSFDDVRRDFLDIRKMFGVPILAVDHLWAALPDGSFARSRSDVSDVLTSLQQSGLVGYWSTREFLQQFGPQALKDQNHWAQSSEQGVGEALVAAALSLCSAQP